jgi:hypothetical protein
MGRLSVIALSDYWPFASKVTSGHASMVFVRPCTFFTRKLTDFAGVPRYEAVKGARQPPMNHMGGVDTR